MKETLLLYGMTSNEAEIYLALLRKGPLNTYVLAQETGFHRGGIYDTVKRMNEKGFTSTVTVKGKTLVQAVDPEVLADIIQVRLKKIEQTIPKLKKLRDATHTDVNIQTHTGTNILKILSRDVLKTVKDGSEILTLGVDESKVFQFDTIYLKQYIQETKRRNIKERVITIKGTPVPKDVKGAIYRALSHEIIGSQPMAIYGNKVAFFSYDQPNSLMIIQDSSLAESKRKQFEHFWKTANKR